MFVCDDASSLPSSNATLWTHGLEQQKGNSTACSKFRHAFICWDVHQAIQSGLCERVHSQETYQLLYLYSGPDERQGWKCLQGEDIHFIFFELMIVVWLLGCDYPVMHSRIKPLKPNRVLQEDLVLFFFLTPVHLPSVCTRKYATTLAKCT